MKRKLASCQFYNAFPEQLVCDLSSSAVLTLKSLHHLLFKLHHGIYLGRTGVWVLEVLIIY
jgi:hypothetical protein